MTDPLAQLSDIYAQQEYERGRPAERLAEGRVRAIRDNGVPSWDESVAMAAELLALRARVVELEGEFAAERSGRVAERAAAADRLASAESITHDVMRERDQARARVAELEAATGRVREVHQPIEALNVRHPGGRPTQVCSGCGTDDGNWQTYPCPTIRALSGPRPVLKLSEVQS